ncbi:MAG TPA: hypothetical protein VFP98_03985, partial [Candidatus Polarisedimenticolia bacterium]|nr:hypothetical protein [Candidatus Polarisedimenticolia bacterium]
THQALDERHGAADRFTPAPDGAVAADRMEVFLAVRDATQASRARLGAAFDALPLSEQEGRDLESQSGLKKLGSVLTILGGAMGLPREMGNFFAARNEALLRSGMGMGEYTYIYALSYYGLLGRRPASEPGSDESRAESGKGGRRGLRIDMPLRPRLHRELLSMLRNQLAAVTAGSGPESAWTGTLRGEIEALEKDTGRTPWSDGLPAPIAASLEPYRSRLEATWSATTEPFELARSRRRGRYSIEAD